MTPSFYLSRSTDEKIFGGIFFSMTRFSVIGRAGISCVVTYREKQNWQQSYDFKKP
jgi:hypothetical protein